MGFLYYSYSREVEHWSLALGWRGCAEGLLLPGFHIVTRRICACALYFWIEGAFKHDRGLRNISDDTDTALDCELESYSHAQRMVEKVCTPHGENTLILTKMSLYEYTQPSRSTRTHTHKLITLLLLYMSGPLTMQRELQTIIHYIKAVKLKPESRH